MLTSALIMSCGALAVALMEDRVPVFEIVVCHWPLQPFMSITCSQVKAQQLLCI